MTSYTARAILYMIWHAFFTYKRRILKMDDGMASEMGDYRNFTGYVLFNKTEGWAENADFDIQNGGWSIIWRSGTWSGTMWNARWDGGVWKGGKWYGHLWNGGTWLDGVWHDGMWHGGDWMNGEWYDGEWFDGTWHDGTWHRGRWLQGTWLGGTWFVGERGDGAELWYPPSRWINMTYAGG